MPELELHSFSSWSPYSEKQQVKPEAELLEHPSIASAERTLPPLL
jgi:hypothetical protein